jgi:LmbE family N-acetylglucosaminyl deacetylase
LTNTKRKYGLDHSNLELRSDYLLVRRPHFHLQDHTLFFMASKQPLRRLSEAELDLWNLMQQPLSVQTARQTCPGCTDDLICNFLESEFCEVVEPAFPSGRQRVLVIEPHADDAALSVGGLMWLRRHECAFVVATMASRSNHTLYHDLGLEYFDIEKVTEIRRLESELFARMIGGDHVSVGLTDAALRYCDTEWTLDYFLPRRIAIRIGISRIPDDQERKRWSESVQRLLADIPSAEVWIPLGGPHTDHMLTVDACLRVFVANPDLIVGRVLRIYQDVPYLARFPLYMNNAIEALRRVGVVLEREILPISDAYDQKLRLTSLYASQNILAMRGAIEGGALAYGPAVGYAEALWTLRALPQRIDSSVIGSVAIPNHERANVVKWVSQNKDTECVRVLLLMPTGRWRADLDRLCNAFPKARFKIYYADSAAAEVADAWSDRAEARNVGAGMLGWVFLGLRFAAAMKPLPTLFYVGERRLREARVLSKLWLGSDTLVVASMDWVTSVLHAQRDVGA